MKPTIGEYVSLHPKAVLGDDVIICDHATIGSIPVSYDGFKLKVPGFGVRIGEGSVIHSGARVVLGSIRDTVIGRECCVGQNAIIGHDCVIGNRVHVMNSVSINGFVEVGALSLIGTGATIRERVRVGSSVIIGMGSNVLSDVPSNVVAYGNPCRVQRSHDGGVKYLAKRVLWG